MIKREMARAVQRIADEAGAADRSDMEKVAAAFGAATELFIGSCDNEMALARAMGDEETAVKEQIKGNVMRTAREIFAYCYTVMSGDRSEVWEE